MTWNTLIENNSGAVVDVNGSKVANGKTLTLNGVHEVLVKVPGSGSISLGEPGNFDFHQYINTSWAVKISSGRFVRYWGYEGGPTLKATINADKTFSLPSSAGLNFDRVPIDDTLPTYECIVDTFMKNIGENPTPDKVMLVAEQLPAYEVKLLSAGPPQGNPTLSPAEEQALALGMAKTISSTDAVPKFKESASDAVRACNAINDMFIKLASMLSTIDSRGSPPPEGPFAPRLADLNKVYRRILSESRTLAVTIANYGDRFDAIIVPICCDTTTSVDQKKVILQGFINEANDFSQKSQDIQDRFDDLVFKFAAFQGGFSTWATQKEGDLGKDLKEATSKLGDLQNELARLKTAMLAMGVIAAASLPATGIIAWLSGPAAPFVIIGGLIIAGISTVAFVALSVAVSNKQVDVDNQQRVVDDLSKQIKEIQDSRVKLTELGNTSLKSFQLNVGLLSNYWLRAHNDSVEIMKWLQQGAVVAEMPKYLCDAVDHAITVYKSLGVYLREYANAIPSDPKVAATPGHTAPVSSTIRT